MAKPVALRPLEAVVQATIIELATLHHWKVAHFHDSRRQVRPGVFVGDKLAAGFPDLVLARDRTIYAELKRAGEKPRRDQGAWLDALARAGGEVYVWTLDDLPEIARVLGSRWRFVPNGDRTRLDGRASGEPQLIGTDVSFMPASTWIAGVGRRERSVASLPVPSPERRG